jgi:14-3-3 protein epsilon
LPRRLSGMKVNYTFFVHCRTLILAPEMAANMKRVASFDQELTVEGRNLLFVAYKTVFGVQWCPPRVVEKLSSIELEESKNKRRRSLIQGYRKKIEKKTSNIYEDILEVLNKHLISSATSAASKVSSHQM